MKGLSQNIFKIQLFKSVRLVNFKRKFLDLRTEQAGIRYICIFIQYYQNHTIKDGNN